MLNKLNALEAAMRGPEFRIKAVKLGGNVAAFITTAVVANLINRAFETGINAVVAKIESSANTTTPTE